MKSLLVLTFVLFYGRTQCQNISFALTDLGCTTFLEALENASLLTTLKDLDNVTLLAPTNDAIDVGGLDSLTYHLINTSIESTDITNELQEPSFSGQEIRFNVYNGQVYTAQGAAFNMSSYNVSIHNGNGYIHVLEAVMTPPTGTIYEYIEKNGSFEILKGAIDTVNLTDTLNSTGSYTVFAPTDEAFDNIPQGDWDALSDTSRLEILLYHGINHTHFSVDLNDGDKFTTFQGDIIIIVDDNSGGISINRTDYAGVTTRDVSVSNGVLHVIDRVLKMDVKTSGATLVSIQISLLFICLALVAKW